MSNVEVTLISMTGQEASRNLIQVTSGLLDRSLTASLDRLKESIDTPRGFISIVDELSLHRQGARHFYLTFSIVTDPRVLLSFYAGYARDLNLIAEDRCLLLLATASLEDWSRAILSLSAEGYASHRLILNEIHRQLLILGFAGVFRNYVRRDCKEGYLLVKG